MSVDVRRPLVRLLLILLLLGAWGCTGGGTPRSSGSPSLFLPAPTGPSSSPPSGSPKPPVVLPVVATLSGPAAGEDQGYVDGMRLAVQEVDRGRGVNGRSLALEFHDDGGDVDRATELIEQALDQKPPAILYVGPAEAVAPLRLRFEEAGTPLVLSAGDLYSARDLFPQVFQTTIPWEWQANVIARYLVKDRKADRTVFVGSGADAETAAGLMASAMAYWGGGLSATVTTRTGGLLEGDVRSKAEGAAAVVGYGPPDDLSRLAGVLADLSRPPQLAAAAGLLPVTPHPPPGTVACSPYTWAGWAQPIPRAGEFRTSFAAANGRPVTGPEQETYDAVRLLAWGLRQGGPKGGADLGATLEKAQGLQFSGFPIDLGPDDHVLPPRDQLGLFAVAGPKERVDPWQIPGSEPWRPIMRTFTTDGRRTSILDEDRTVFFPGWTKYKPGPYYWRSIYGIATRPGQDPLH
jgi:ABC-type branched-subunit amino acid transport system substrate-binding protein